MLTLLYLYLVNIRKIAQALTLTGFVFGVLGFVYIAGNAWFHPQSLSWPLTHFSSFPREDTFGAFCFGGAMVSFFIYNLLKRDQD
jgi:hypothetical protein